MFTKAAVLTALAAAAFAVAAPAQAAPAATTALPTANMEAVLKAAQIDPRRADDTQTPGAHDSVLLVEQALQAKGLLAANYVDGYFGTTTITAYSQYQKSLGYTGIDASGLPGKTSLEKLGEGRYTVTNPVSAGSRVAYHGVTINTRTKAMLLAAEKIAGIVGQPDAGLVQPRRRRRFGRHARRRRRDGHLGVRHVVGDPDDPAEGAAQGRVRGLVPHAGAGFRLPHPRHGDLRPGSFFRRAAPDWGLLPWYERTCQSWCR